MDLSTLRRLSCPSCGRPHDLLVLLDRVRDIAPTGPWAAFGCPACGAAAHLELSGEQVAIGRLVEDRGLRFEPHMRIHQPGLHVQGYPDGVRVRLLHRAWIFERRR